MDSTGPDMKPGGPPLDSWRRRATADDLARYDADRARGDRIGAMKIKFRASFYHAPRGEAFVDRLSDDQIHLDVARLSVAYERDYRVARSAAPFPVTIMAGEIDWIRGSEPRLHTIYPSAHFMVIPHAGHFPWADAPEATRRILKQALDR